MTTLFVTHPDCLDHDTGAGHPECAARLTAIEERLSVTHVMDFLTYRLAPAADTDTLALAHTQAHITQALTSPEPLTYRYLDPDTCISKGSARAARLAAGAVTHAIDQVVSQHAQSAFCSVRPPGHHANAESASGFCVFNSIAIGARYALQQPGVDRVAVIDFDVHHGNGTEEILQGQDNVLFCSTFQHPYYPHTAAESISRTRVSVPLAKGSSSSDFRAAVEQYWIPALEQFQPQLILISAGFDAHRDDLMGGLALTDDDYAWVTQKIRDIADRFAQGKIVSSLEGGYDLKSLARSVERHVRVLARLEGTIADARDTTTLPDRASMN